MVGRWHFLSEFQVLGRLLQGMMDFRRAVPCRLICRCLELQHRPKRLWTCYCLGHGPDFLGGARFFSWGDAGWWGWWVLFFFPLFLGRWKRVFTGIHLSWIEHIALVCIYIYCMNINKYIYIHYIFTWLPVYNGSPQDVWWSDTGQDGCALAQLIQSLHIAKVVDLWVFGFHSSEQWKNRLYYPVI